MVFSLDILTQYPSMLEETKEYIHTCDANDSCICALFSLLISRCRNEENAMSIVEREMKGNKLMQKKKNVTK